uniref:Probable lysosomal cobalamin transporter isoform X2 n=1 Tax=Dermatophagoides pteronyssinus TaxID=6956 RepID=A0A6P6Y0W8_DERPT|nr:probable lysosomal cobalamin transporter isoform X2 [Dermatophagoides pteronyssinus]
MYDVFPNENLAGILSSSLFALLFIIIFSIYYVRKYSNLEDSIRTTNITAIISLIIALLTCSLLPVDIFIVSSMKYSNGTFKEWASNITERQHFSNQILYTYYSLYSLIFMFIFLVIPFVYFYFEERESSIFDTNPLLTSLRNTFIFVLLAAFFLLIGAFVPLRPTPDPNNNGSWIDKFKNIINVLEKNRGEDAMSMVLSILSAFGVTIVAIYTAFGMFSWPVSLIKGTKSARTQLQDIEDRHLNNSFNINSLREKLRTTGQLTDREMNRLRILEEQERMTNLEESFVNEYRESYFYRLRFLFRPIQMTIGSIILLISILVWISLLITNIDKAFHSLGMHMGYALVNSTYPNPINFILSELQTVYPLDYILILSLSFSLVMYTISGFKHIGIRFLCIKLYKIKPGKTAPQGILLLFASIMLAILGINVLFYSAFPQYATYGRQFYQEQTSNNTYTAKICNLDSPKDSCTMTRMSALLLRFFYKAWFFGAYYYWMMWTFLIVSLCSFVYVSLRPKQTVTQGLLESEFENENY